MITSMMYHCKTTTNQKNHGTNNGYQNFESSQKSKGPLTLLDREQCRAVTKESQIKVTIMPIYLLA